MLANIFLKKALYNNLRRINERNEKSHKQIEEDIDDYNRQKKQEQEKLEEKAIAQKKKAKEEEWPVLEAPQPSGLNQKTQDYFLKKGDLMWSIKGEDKSLKSECLLDTNSFTLYNNENNENVMHLYNPSSLSI